MSTTTSCPKCEARLRLSEEPEVGEEIECPKCGRGFVPNKGVTQTRRPARPREEERDVARPWQNPKPSRSDAGRFDDDEDEAPRIRKAGRPKPRRPNSDDDDFDRNDRSRQQSEGSNLGLVIGLIAGGGLLFLLLIAGAVYAVLSPKRDGGPEEDVAARNPAQVASDTFRPQADDAPTGSSSTNPASRPVSQPNTPIATPSPNAELSADLVEKTRKATVFIHVEAGTNTFTGSGFIVKANGDTAYIVTNHHVIAAEADPPEKEPKNDGPTRPGRPGGPLAGRPPALRPPGFGGPNRIPGFGPPAIGPGAMNPPKGSNKPEPKNEPPKVTVMLNRGTAEEYTLRAETVAADEDADLAVLRIVGARNLPAAIDLAEDASIFETMPVRIFGFPGAQKDIYIGKGVVSQLRRDDRGELMDMQINGQINPGNSGGPVVDTLGRLVGVAVSHVPGKNLGFAIPTAQLNHMFRGAVQGGLVFRLKQQGSAVSANGEIWRFNRKNRVAERTTLDVTLDPTAARQTFPPNEFHAIAYLNDPMHKIASANVLYCVKQPDSVVKAGDGWGPLNKAQKLPLLLKERAATATLKLASGAVQDEMYAVQFSYVNGDGLEVFMEPHLVRFTFPKSNKLLAIAITGVPDTPTKRYVEERLKAALAGMTFRSLHTPDGLRVEVDAVEDPKSVADRIDFGAITISGWTLSVTVKNLELPRPTTDEVDAAIKDLKSADKKVRTAAADRLAKCYVPLPDRLVEVAKALEPLALDKDFWTGQAGVRALAIWAAPENVPGLAGYLEQSDGDQRRSGIVAIVAKFKDPAAAKGLASCLTSGFDRGAAAAALKAIGPAAEKEVIPFIDHKDGWTAKEACLVLKEIGTKESIAPLQKLVDSKPNFLVAGPANEALQAVKNRK